MELKLAMEILELDLAKLEHILMKLKMTDKDAYDLLVELVSDNS